MKKNNIKLLSKISEIETNYSAFILDIWGVLWDGLEAYDDAIRSLIKLKEKNKPVILLSNAPRRSKTVEKRLEKIGIKKDYYTKIVSSGEICRKKFLQNTNYLSKIGNTFYFIGQKQDKDLVENLPLSETKNIQKSNFLLVCGTRRFEDSLEIYKNELDTGLSLKIPLICANPDKVVVRKNGNRLLCAGEFANYYKRREGKVFYFGKPYLDVYLECTNFFKSIDTNICKKNILVVGDSIETDIRGANQYGLSSVLVTGGIHANQFSKDSKDISIEKAQLICKEYSEYPTFIIEKFIF